MILVPILLTLLGMSRTLVSVMALIAGSILLASDPSNTANLSATAIPGSAMLSGALLMVGVALWVRDY